MKKLFAIVALAMVLTACDRPPRMKTQYHGQVKSYRVNHHNTDGSSEWIYWYFLYSTIGNTSSTYYYSSPTPVTDYSQVPFSRTPTLPPEAQAAIKEGEAMATQEIAQEALPPGVQEQVVDEEHTQEAAFEVSADHEASQDGGTSESESGSSSDSGGGDSGGGGGE